MSKTQTQRRIPVKPYWNKQTAWVRIVWFYQTERERPWPELFEDACLAKAVITQYVRVPLEGHQRDALISLLIDLVGAHAEGNEKTFEHSKLLGYLNEGLYQMAASEFMAFAYRNGKLDATQWRKRNCEQNLFRCGRLILGH